MTQNSCSDADSGVVTRDYVIMSDQPNACPKCGARTDLLSTGVEDGITVYTEECLSCGLVTLFVED